MEDITLRPFHRGAYENLWAEHRYALLAVSFKKFRLAIGKLGRHPHVLAFLATLQRAAEKPWGEWNHALLNAYDHVRPHLDRPGREQLIERVLAEDPGVPAELFELVRRHAVSSLYGCRLFYPRRAVAKIFDFGDQPGLWLCLGPTLVHLSWGALRARFQARMGVDAATLDGILAALADGLAPAAWEALPDRVREVLETHAAVAVTPTRAWLHPRLPVPLPTAPTAPAAVTAVPAETVAWLALERFWDLEPGMLPALPTFDEWLDLVDSAHLPELSLPDRAAIEPAFGPILDAFLEQQDREHGRGSAPAPGPGEGDVEDLTAPPEGEDPADPLAPSEDDAGLE
ncbi:MAG: hypothetical protein GX442_16510 [Candidatus Riflebacteria bacterium]|nr:hypothetical protein [Candidatus Riflebacteria bacterium]